MAVITCLLFTIR